ncbi:MAG: hypothetical protein ACQCN5_13590 [Candidatus Bathyarchaeia archaeon]|jgi:hypothetical protein
MRSKNKPLALLLVALFVSSAFFGACNGGTWFEGHEHGSSHQVIWLYMQHKLPVVSPYTGLPVVNLYLSEAQPKISTLTIVVTTWALGYQNENFETWLSIDDQEPEKLVGILDVTGSAAGEFYERKYNTTLSGLGDGSHFLKIRVAGDYYGPPELVLNYDCEGNVSLLVDTTPPKVSVLFLANKTHNSASVPLNFTTNEQISHSSYSLDGQENVTVAGNTTLTGLSAGDHNVTVYAEDEAGNVGASATVWFSVVEPFPLVPVAAASVAVVVVVFGLLVYLKKRQKTKE